jgi:hypothetical protein
VLATLALGVSQAACLLHDPKRSHRVGNSVYTTLCRWRDWVLDRGTAMRLCAPGERMESASERQCEATGAPAHVTLEPTRGRRKAPRTSECASYSAVWGPSGGTLANSVRAGHATVRADFPALPRSRRCRASQPPLIRQRRQSAGLAPCFHPDKRCCKALGCEALLKAHASSRDPGRTARIWHGHAPCAPPAAPFLRSERVLQFGIDQTLCQQTSPATV